MTEQVLIVLHQEQSTPGRVGYALRRPRLRPRHPPPALRRSAAHHDGRACRRRDLRRPAERQRSRRLHQGRDRLHRRAAAREQALSRHLPRRADAGASISASACSRIRKARPRSATIRSSRPPAGRAICDWPAYMYQWHREGFDLPRGAELLAEGDIFRTQAFRAGTGFAIQFHAEVTHAMMCRWTTRGAARMEIARRQAAPRAFRRPPGLRPRHPRLAVGFPRPLARDRRAAQQLAAAE